MARHSLSAHSIWVSEVQGRFNRGSAMQMSWCSDLSTSVAMRDASGQASPELNIRRVYELGDIGHIVIDIGLGFVT